MVTSTTDKEDTKAAREMPAINGNKPSLTELCKSIEESICPRSESSGTDPTQPELLGNIAESRIPTSGDNIGRSK